MTISKPSSADIPKLLELWKRQFEYHHSIDDVYFVAYSGDLRREFETYLQKAIGEDAPHILVARDNERIVGFVTFTEDTATYFDTQIKTFGVVIELYVSEKARARGIGKALMKAAEVFFISKGLRDIKVCSSSFNQHARDFYKHLGYIEREIAFFKKL